MVPGRVVTGLSKCWFLLYEEFAAFVASLVRKAEFASRPSALSFDTHVQFQCRLDGRRVAFSFESHEVDSAGRADGGDMLAIGKPHTTKQPAVAVKGRQTLPSAGVPDSQRAVARDRRNHGPIRSNRATGNSVGVTGQKRRAICPASGVPDL